MDSSSVVSIVVIGILICFLMFCVRMIASTRKTQAEGKRIRQQLKDSGLIITAYGEHMAGLPVVEGMFCMIHEFADRFCFSANGVEFNLDKAKIMDISIKTDKEITQQYVSSVGGAVAGAVLFGPLGAIVGGRAKKKKNTIVSQYLIFTYSKDGNVDYISFDVTKHFIEANKIWRRFLIETSGNKASVNL